MAKLFVSGSLVRTALDAVQIHGRYRPAGCHRQHDLFGNVGDAAEHHCAAGLASELPAASATGPARPPAQILHTSPTEAIDFARAFGGGPVLHGSGSLSSFANAVKVAVYAVLRSVQSLPCKTRTGGLP